MRIHHATLDTCHTATDTVVVIDVFRAFTTAAFAFAAGATDIIPVSSVEEAFSLREQFPGSLVMGEVGGFPPDGFDFGNSPAALIGQALHDKRLIQRTSAGTQGVTRSVNAETMLTASFVCAGATVRFVQQIAPADVTFVSTGNTGEDQACAHYLETLLRGDTPDVDLILGRVQAIGQQRIDDAPDSVAESIKTAFAADVKCCVDLDRFDFAMQVQREGDLMIMKAI